MTQSSQCLPEVGIVIPTHNRPQLMRYALDSVLDQDYAGTIKVVVVFDRCEPDFRLERDEPRRSVKVLANERTPGLAGNRNTGILALDTELIGFCDDDDAWLPGKLSAQVELLVARPDVDFVTTAMRVAYADRSSTVRLAGQTTVTIQDLARSRMAMLHSSSFLFRSAAMREPGGFGLVDETIPRSMGEDWDLLLRAARARPIEHIDVPLVRVLSGESSYFRDVWTDKLAANVWLLEHHPEIGRDRTALGLMLGKQAFGNAALGRRRKALATAAKALRHNWREPRTPLALLVVAGVPSKVVVTYLNRRGRSI